VFNKFFLYSLLFWSISFVSIGCDNKDSSRSLEINWTEIEKDLPQGISLYYGADNKLPLKAWVVKIDGNMSNIKAKVLVSHDTDKRETVEEFVDNTQAVVAINAGYFLMHMNPTHHVGLLKADGQLVEPASESIIRQNLRYSIARGAFGIDKNNMFDIAWASTKNDSLFEWVKPLNNSNGNPVSNLNFEKAQFWDMEHAVHAGPVIVHDAKLHVCIDEEVFFGTKIPELHPRTAVGYTRDNSLILVVVDGRQSDSRGASLEDLANIMLQFDCIEALNLDGGGSSTMVINGELINRPAGGVSQREVMSSIAVFVNE